MAARVCGLIRGIGRENHLLSLNIFYMVYKSKYFPKKEVELPAGWAPEEFWWAVEKLEKLKGENLFMLCLELDVLDGKTPRGSVNHERMVKKILYEGDKNRILDIFKRTGGFISKYFSIDYSPLPNGWTPEEFWWAVEQLERYGNEANLFDLASKLDIKYDEVYRYKVSVDELISVIITEGGIKDKIIVAIKEFVEIQKKNN